jgi:hypothetical protein
MAMKDLDVKLEETTTVPWDVWYAEIVDFRTTHRNCLVPYFHVTKNSHALWYWVLKVRADKARGKLSEKQIKLLDDLDFIWVQQDDAWEKGIAALMKYKEDYGDCVVPNGFRTKDQFPLGLWVYQQRTFDGNYPREKYNRLKNLKFVWNLREYNWGQAFGALKAYKSQYGDCLVPSSYVTDDRLDLGSWVIDQRLNRQYEYMPKEKVEKLDELGFVWGRWNNRSEVIFVPKKRAT